MALSNTQYDTIKKVYEDRRLKHVREQEERKREVSAKIPGFQELQANVIETSMQYARVTLGHKNNSDKEDSDLKDFHAKMLDLRLQKAKMLTAAGYPADYLELTYDCIKCRDTGYIDSEKCSCFRQMEVQFLYDSSQIRELLAVNNFSNLSKDYYSGESLEQFEHALTTCKNFINNFNSDYHNLFFYGTVGTGKSFLSGCVAKELLDRGCSIIYFSAIQMFQTISAYHYDKDKEMLNKLNDSLYNCDLLIIDDLGTEMINEFVRSQLFLVLNERILRRKSIIISTNLTLEELRGKYSDRVFSRICESFEMCRFTGKDIRLQKKLELMNRQ